ncbi:MAG: T9SS type A sorting domain-containing protein [Candidatus Cloacimonadaceae bacterium]|nr:T9SS type A sorting domain-containing protein [Candidatus Cloacimonadaceae bacterium]
MKARILIITALLLLCAMLGAQANGHLTQMGGKDILHVWGNHFERGHAQGYYLGSGVLEIFNDYYFTMVVFSSPTHYNYLWSYYQEHFNQHPRMYSEAQGLIAGMQDAGLNAFHAGLQRDLNADDVMLVNSIVDMIQVRGSFAGDDVLELGCASLSSWGVSTQQDSLLAGSSVITRFLDWSQNSALIANPVLIVHHPSESDEQPWMSFTFPGLLGALTAISHSGVYASLNMGSEHYAANTNGVDPILFSIRDGIERTDYNADGAHNPMDVFNAIDDDLQHSGTIIHTLFESQGVTTSFVVETKNSATALRYYNQGGNLPGNHLAATNHFRALSSGICCTRYANIQDSLYTNHHINAKRQWNVLSGAAGLESNLSAIQYTPSTGKILWSSADIGLPAYLSPAITLEKDLLFSFSVSNQDDYLSPAQAGISLYPNPLRGGSTLSIKSDAKISSVAIYNVRGQLLAKMDTGGKRGTFSLPAMPQDLPTGIYLLRFETAGQKPLNRKLMIVK